MSELEQAWSWLRTVGDDLDANGCGQVYGVVALLRPYLGEGTEVAASVLEALAGVVVARFVELTGLPFEEVRAAYDAAAERSRNG